MKTDGLSINLATVRQQFGLKDGVEACLKHGVKLRSGLTLDWLAANA